MGKRGPAPGPARKGTPTGIRFDVELKERIAAAATEAGRSFSEEVVRRLSLSLAFDRQRTLAFDDPAAEALVTYIAYALDQIEDQCAAPWSRDPWTFEQASEAIREVVSFFRPVGAFEVPDSAKVIRALRAVGQEDVAEIMKVQLKEAGPGKLIGKMVMAWAEEAAEDGADAKPELRRLIPIAQLMKARLLANAAEGQARTELNTMTSKGPAS